MIHFCVLSFRFVLFCFYGVKRPLNTCKYTMCVCVCVYACTLAPVLAPLSLYGKDPTNYVMHLCWSVSMCVGVCMRINNFKFSQQLYFTNWKRLTEENRRLVRNLCNDSIIHNQPRIFVQWDVKEPKCFLSRIA